MRALAQALVIARRDYVWTVFSRYFLLFLLGPVLAGVFSGYTVAAGRAADAAANVPRLAIIAPASEAARLEDAAGRMRQRLGDDVLPVIEVIAPAGDAAVQGTMLLSRSERPASMVLTGFPARPLLTGAEGALTATRGAVEQMVEMAGSGTGTTRLRTHAVAASGARDAEDAGLARLAQTALFVLTMLLAGAMLSNMVEEKSNKVIEVLAAAMPIDRIFLGKLIAMVGVSLTGIAIWAVMGGMAAAWLVTPGQLPAPAVGWPLMALLGLIYFIMNYMLIGGIFLGIGAQAVSVREVQTLSMPVTMAQLGLFALVTGAQPDGTGGMAAFATWFPLSSPMMMLGRAAVDGAILPHLLAIAWQALWVALILRFAASRFRQSVLNNGASGGGRRWWRRA